MYRCTYSHSRPEEEKKLLLATGDISTPIQVDSIVLQFIRNFSDISVMELENILETLQDYGCLNEKGDTLRS